MEYHLLNNILKKIKLKENDFTNNSIDYCSYTLVSSIKEGNPDSSSSFDREIN
jgi:hypothetical protein